MNNRIYKLFAVLAVVLLLTAALPIAVFAEGGSATVTAIVYHERTVTLRPVENGNITVSPEGVIHDGDMVTFTITPDDGFYISALFYNGEDVKAGMVGNTLTVTVSGDIDIYPVFAPNPHVHEWEDEYTIDKKPTCTEKGQKSIHCKTCPETKDVTEIPATGHDFGQWETVNAATCEDEGIECRKCKTCGYTETRGIDPTAHEWEEDYTVDKEPTCHEDGSKSIHCKHCGATKDSTVIPHLEHEWINGTVTKEATDTEEGEMVYTCAHCGEKKTVVIPAKTSPQTGDNSHLTLWIAIASGSLFLLILMLCKRRKEDTEEA